MKDGRKTQGPPSALARHVTVLYNASIVTPKAVKLLENALELPENDRADLAARLIDSLDRQVDDDAPSAWDAEIALRIADVDRGSVKAIPWPEARRMSIIFAGITR